MNEQKNLWEKFLDLFGAFTSKFEKLEDTIKAKTGIHIPIGTIVGGIILFASVYLFLKVVLGIINYKLHSGDY